ncbi:flavin reductase [Moraxella sp. FZFQ2102]|uniref:flavin reductase n=1 Tax=Moraxella sp. FZFQ2102 TaxID=2953752 RepID=UPI00209C3F75|nr:flavin reductase [Moraxella sp. FZFQ2102]USZ15169.1 flavin reductase [Moraxella sp. FZFQ2102]
MITNTEFRNAMSKLVSAVHIVTTDGKSGRHGFTASAVCSVTDTPPTLLVCMNGNARSYEHFVENQVLCVNTLSERQADLSGVFASPLTADERFAKAGWTMLATGSPVLCDSLVSFDCQIDEIKTVGTHSIFICKIIAVKSGDGTAKGLAYCDRAYHSVVAQG